VNLECRSETCCARLAENTGRKKVPKNRHLGTIAQLCRAISLQLSHISAIGKNLLSSNISSTCPHNMVNFGQLAAEIGPVVWGHPCKFQRVSQTIIFSSCPFVMVALCNRETIIFLACYFYLLPIFFFSSPNLSGRKLDVYHTLTHGVALVRI